MSKEKEKERIALSERWTKIATILPNSISSSTNHPSLLVDPSGFRRVVKTSLQTCETFLKTLQMIEDGLEKRIQGITSYYGLVVAPNRQSSIVRNYGGVVSVSGSVISLSDSVYHVQDGRGYTSLAADRVQSHVESPEPPTEQPKSKTSIFEKIGNTMLRNNYKLENDEVISFNRGLEILSKLDSLRDVATECITTFGALDEILEVGKIFSYRNETDVHYYGEHAIQQTKSVQESMVPLASYWGTLSCINRIRTIEKKLKPNLAKI